MVGPSDPSIPNTSAALLERVPHLPPVAPTKNSATTQTTLVVDYQHLYGTANGGATVTSYQIQWDQGADVAAWVDLDVSLNSQVIISAGI